MDEIQFLKFEDLQKEISGNRLTNPWITVYCFHRGVNESIFTICALMPNEKNLTQKILANSSWDISVEYGNPCFWQEGVNGSVHYDRFGRISHELPFEPLIIYRSFHGRWERYLELSEEFRLYHNLYFDVTKNQFIFLSKSGEEDVVASVEKEGDNSRVQIKTRYLRDFLAAKSVVLVRFHNRRRFLSKDLTRKLGKDIIRINKKKANFCFDIVLNPNPEFILDKQETLSSFFGKEILPPLSKPLHEDYRSLTGNDEEERYADFIIGSDEEGSPIEHTCNPEVLSNFFGANPDAPNYLTPVFFRPDVLKKYYEQPSKYSVEDTHLRCCDLWGMRYGRNSAGFVHAWLGDLGRDIPYNEQLHWKQFNVLPEGGLGKATIERELFAEFADPDEMTHIFKFNLDNFSEVWGQKFGWDLFLALRKDDEHYIKSLHVPLSEEPLEFDQQILALAKILPDSINTPEIKQVIQMKDEDVKKLIDFQTEADIPPIFWVKAMLIYFFKMDKAKADKMVQPLKNIQSLRSSSAAHRRGEIYDEIAEKLRLDTVSRILFFKNLLQDIAEILKQLRTLVENI